MCMPLSFHQNPKFQEPVTLDLMDAELENDVKVEVLFVYSLFSVSLSTCEIYFTIIRQSE